MKAFRLSSFAELDPDSGEPTLEVNFDAGRPDSPGAGEGTASWTTILTGRNGGGKSRTLRAVTSLLAGSREGRLRTRGARKLWEVRYSVGDTQYLVRTDRREKVAVFKDGVEVAIEQAEFPSRIIAASAAANDKFPNARRYPLPDDYYYYFGLRDATGRASGIAPLLSALQALSAAEAGDARRINAVATVFRLLGYREVLTHRYGWRYLRHLRQGESPSSLYVQGSLGPDARHRIEGLLRHDPDVLEKLDAAVASAKITSSKSLFWEIEADFSKENIGAKSNASREFSDSNLLRRAGLIRLESVILKRLGDGALLDLREASSGQISLATTFLGIAASITDGALVLIDEPEISLHPEWQAAYLGLAQRLFSSYTGCHFLVATHSPSVVAGMSETNANAVSLDLASVGPEVSSNYGGDSVDELLVREFGVYESGNLFLQKELARALDLASVGEISSDAFRHAVEVISPAAIELKDEPFGRLVASLLRAAKHADDSEVGSVSR